MEAKLIVVGGKANKAEVQLTLPAVIGRGRDADLTVAHATVSRRHCLLYERDGALVVRDNGSLNGTVIEGERIQEAVLRPGATLTVGPLTFRAEYDHQGDFPNLGAQPKLANAAVAAQPANGTLHKEPPTAAADSMLAPAAGDGKLAPATADSELAISLPDTEPPVDEESPSFGFLSGTAESPAAAPVSNSAAPPVDDEAPSFGFLTEKASEPAVAGVPPAAHATLPAEAADSADDAPLSGAAANAGKASADSGDLGRLAIEPAAAKEDSADFGFLGGLGEPELPSGADSQLPEITLHDPEEDAAANADSGDYALLSDTPAAPLDLPAAEKPVAKNDQAYSLAVPASESAADGGDHRPAKANPAQPAAKKNVEPAPVKASAAESRPSDSDIDAAALGFLNDAPAVAHAEKSSQRAGKPAEKVPDIKVGAEQPKAATAEDEELNSFFNSLGLD